MSRDILVPVDGSPQSRSALAFAAGEWPDAALTLLHVIDPVAAGGNRGVMPSGSEAWYQNAKERAHEIFDEGRTELDGDRDVDEVIEVGRPARTIVEVADEGGYDHVVVGSHGRTGVSRIVLGSVAENVVRRSPVPVTIVR
mgnify:CR=1 FL=1